MGGSRYRTTTHYAGGYDFSGRRLVRRSDGHSLEIRHSTRSGPEYTPTYLYDVTLSRYVSNLYSRPYGGAEFEWEAVRYEIIREGKCAVRIEERYRYRSGGSRRVDRHPAGSRQLGLFTS